MTVWRELFVAIRGPRCDQLPTGEERVAFEQFKVQVRLVDRVCPWRVSGGTS
jgi:hypothetical protein